MLGHAKLLYGLLAVLGIIFLATVFAIMADDAIYIYVWEFFSPIQHLMTFLWWFWLLGGIFFLTAGIVGIGRQYLVNSPNPFTRRRVDSFTIVAVMIILSVVFALFCYFWMGMLEIGY